MEDAFQCDYYIVLRTSVNKDLHVLLYWASLE